MPNFKRGKQSFILESPPVITSWASVAGKKEAAGPLANSIDILSDDSYFVKRHGSKPKNGCSNKRWKN